MADGYLEMLWMLLYCCIDCCKEKGGSWMSWSWSSSIRLKQRGPKVVAGYVTVRNWHTFGVWYGLRAQTSPLVETNSWKLESRSHWIQTQALRHYYYVKELVFLWFIEWTWALRVQGLKVSSYSGYRNTAPEGCTGCDTERVSDWMCIFVLVWVDEIFIL